MAKKYRLRRLLDRDSNRCGIHVGGCGQGMTIRTSTVDHIIPLNVLRTDEDNFPRLPQMEEYMQPMCGACNNGRKNGQLDLEFRCNCHSATTVHERGTVNITVEYRKDLLNGYSLRIPGTETRHGVLVSGVTADGSIGFAAGRYGGLFDSTFLSDSRGRHLNLDNPIVAEAPPEPIAGKLDHLEINVESLQERRKRTMEALKAFKRILATPAISATWLGVHQNW